MASKQYKIIEYNSRETRKKKSVRILLLVLGSFLVLVGAALLLVAFNTKPGEKIAAIFYTDTPTPTFTATFTATPEFTATPTATSTPEYTSTPTLTPTPEGPHMYTVEEGDNCWYIAVDQFGVSFDTFMAINNLAECNISPGDQLIIPAAGQLLPTSTPIDLSIYATGQKLSYTAESNDTYISIAEKFNTTVELIKEENNITSDDVAPRIGTVLTIYANRK